MASAKLLHVLSWVPLVAVGLITAILGLWWLMVGEPWVMDRMISPFFGLSLLALGTLICAYVLITLMGTRRARNTLITVLGVLIASLFYLEYRFIPGSPFLTLTWVLLIPYLVSLWATLKLNKSDLSSRP